MKNSSKMMDTDNNIHVPGVDENTGSRTIDRRNFLKTAGAAVVSTAILGSLAPTPVAAASAKSAKPIAKGDISVHYEWGTLKEVVCGIPFAKFPWRLPKSIYNSAPAEGLKFMEKASGKTLQEADPELFNRAKEQMDAAVAILEERGVKVHRPLPLSDLEMQYVEDLFPASGIQFHPRDPMLVIGNRFIETELLLPVRRRERFGIRRALAERLANSNAQIASIPPATPVPEDNYGSWGPGPFLEGGDVFVLGKDIYVGNSGNASITAGIKWLAQYLGDEYNVHEVKLTKVMLHLDCCLATPRPGLAVVCREGFADGLPEFLKGWTLVDVPVKDAKEKLAANGLVIDEKTIMISEGFDYLAKGLRKAGQEVIETPFDAVYLFGGAFRCWHHPLVRKS